MKKPNIDITDPKTLAGAKRVATRRNNDFVRKIRKKLPLFESVLMADFVPDTPEAVIERRAAAQEANAEWFKEKKRHEAQQTRKVRDRCRQMCVDDSEFFDLMQKAVKMPVSRSMRWNITEMKLKRRSVPLTDTEDMVLAWTSAETDVWTHWDIWRRRGDGLDWKAIGQACQELERRELIKLVGSKRSITDTGTEILAVAYASKEYLNAKTV